MPLFVPPEVIQLILDQVSNRTDLARCCSTSKTFLSLTRPLLYHSVEIKLRHSTVSPLAFDLFQIHAVSTSLLSSIRQFKHLRDLIRQVSLIRDSFSDEQYSTFIKVKPDAILKELLESIPLLERFFLRDFRSVLELDSVVSQHQRKLRQEREIGVGDDTEIGPAISLVFSGDEIGVRELSGVYAGFGFTAISWSLSVEELDFDRLLVRSKNTLRYLSIPLHTLTQSSSISTLPHLERLSARLSTAIGDVSVLKMVLSSTPSLLSLHLHGTTSCEILSKLLLKEEFAKSLPPLLSHLSLSYQLPSKYLSSFLAHLPHSTSLKRLCCPKETGYRWWAATGDSNGSEEAETLAVVVEYRERGIKLSFDEEYTIW
ncbi:hypothetical protein JCM3765_006315 [Sporobolomyces pararoseus]